MVFWQWYKLRFPHRVRAENFLKISGNFQSERGAETSVCYDTDYFRYLRPLKIKLKVQKSIFSSLFLRQHMAVGDEHAEESERWSSEDGKLRDGWVCWWCICLPPYLSLTLFLARSY